MGVKQSMAEIALASTWMLLPAFVSAQPPLADPVVEPLGLDDAAFFVHPDISQSHFRFVVTMLTRSARVPVGFEEVVQEPQTHDGNLAKVPIEKRTPLIGLTVAEALDALVAADHRYTWLEQDGMLLIRPVELE